MVNLFEKTGYADIKSILAFAYERNLRHVFIVGGRGTGKTFGALNYAYVNDKKFLLLRRRQKQIDSFSNDVKNPLRPVAEFHGENVTAIKTDGDTFFYKAEEDEKQKGKLNPYGAPIGFAACATSSNSRGFAFGKLDLIIYDEFIPERSDKRIKAEAEALLHVLETVDRNAETPVLFLANAMDMRNAIYRYLNLVDVSEEMERKRQVYKILEEKSVLMIHLYDSPISKKKSQNALYKLTGGTDFYDMSIGNAFAFETKDKIKSYPLKEFAALVEVGTITILQHKSLGAYYCISKTGMCKKKFGNSDIEILRFRSEFPDLYEEFIFGEMYFDRYSTQTAFEDIFR